MKLFRDSDTGWHIRNGESILATGRLETTDPYSFSRPGKQWFAWEWASDVAMGAAHRAGGLSGVALLFAAAIGASAWAWFRLHWAAGSSFLLACLMTPLMLSTANLHWLARPHVFGWLFLMAAVLWMERARGALLFGLFTALWANMHASFFLAPAVALIFATGCMVRSLIWNLDRDSSRTRFYLLAAAASAAGSFLTPHGWQLHRHLLGYLSSAELLQRIGEFQSFNFQTEGAVQILLAVLVSALGLGAMLAARRIDHFLLSALLLAIALRSARGLPVLALIVLPLAAGAFTEIAARARGLRFRATLDRLLQYSSNLRSLETRSSGYVWIPVILLLGWGYLNLPAVKAATGFPAGDFPVAASQAVAQLPPQARILAPDKFGGYLIYRFEGNRKIFFDGRSDFYGLGFMKSYIDLVEVRPGWEGQLARWQFTHALLPNRYSLIPALATRGWTKIYADGTATLLQSPQGNN